MIIWRQSPKNIEGYKSNKHFIKDTFRCMDSWDFRQRQHENSLGKYKLDYRVINECYNCFPGYSYEAINELNKSVHNKINDVITIAQNLGFNVVDDSRYIGTWSPGEKKEFYHDVNGELKLFAEIKAFKNGNIHMKFDQKFMRAFNVEAGRLLGWLKDAEEANTELNIKDGAELFNSNIKLLPSKMRLLTA